MNVIDKAMERFPATNRDDWRQVGEAAVHKDCTVGERAKFLGPAICIGGVIRGGVIHGGVIWGGEIHGGVIRGGEIHGGVIWGGVIRQTPLHIFGACKWPVIVSKPGHVSVGCECHTPEFWRENIDGIARKHKVGDAEKARVMRCVEIAAQWIIDNPNAVVNEAKAAGGK